MLCVKSNTILFFLDGFFVLYDHLLNRSNLQNPNFPICFQSLTAAIPMEDYGSSDDDYRYSDQEESDCELYENNDQNFELLSSTAQVLFLSISLIFPFLLFFSFFLFDAHVFCDCVSFCE